VAMTTDRREFLKGTAWMGLAAVSAGCVAKGVASAERTQLHCMMLENCCYGETELLFLNLCRLGKIGELSERSVKNRSSSVDVPDFTRGGWKTAEPLGIVDIDLGKVDMEKSTVSNRFPA